MCIAIIAGTRAVAAVTSTIESLSATSGSATVGPDRTVELIPLKATVNGAHLEKEVYLMFANVVTFSPGEDGLVADTRHSIRRKAISEMSWRKT